MEPFHHCDRPKQETSISYIEGWSSVYCNLNGVCLGSFLLLLHIYSRKPLALVPPTPHRLVTLSPYWSLDPRNKTPDRRFCKPLAAAAMRFPSLVMLEPFVFRRDDEDSFPDDTKAPIRASATTSWGARFSIALDIAQPRASPASTRSCRSPDFHLPMCASPWASWRPTAISPCSASPHWRPKKGQCRTSSSTAPTRTRQLPPPRSEHFPLEPSPTLIWSDAATAAYLVVTVVPPLLLLPTCNEHGTIYAISSDFGDRMTTQSMGLMVVLSEHF